MDFEKRLQRAIQRGQQSRDEAGRMRSEEQLNEEQFRQLHSKCRLDLCEHIEACLKKLADHFPGFRFETLVSEDGWGAKISRDDLQMRPGKRPVTLYSRLQMVVRPFSESHIIAIAAKGAIRNKEVLSRTHFQFLSQADIESFSELIDLWVLEYAEKYASGN